MPTLRAALIVSIGVVMFGCGAPRFTSEIATDATGLRTFTWVSEYNGVLRDCGSNLSVGLTGILVGRTASEPVGLKAGDGRVLSVVWPAGFTASRSPVSLANERGQIVALGGDEFELVDVDSASAAGTPEDPYIASGRVFGGCYVYEPVT